MILWTASIFTLTNFTSNTIATVSQVARAYVASLRIHTRCICITSTCLVTLVNVFAKMTLETLITLTDVAPIRVFTSGLLGANTSVPTLVNIVTVWFIYIQIPVYFGFKHISIATTTTVAAYRIHAVDVFVTEAIVFLALIKVYTFSSDYQETRWTLAVF